MHVCVHVTRKGGAWLCGGAEICMEEDVCKEMGPFWTETWPDDDSRLKGEYFKFAVCLFEASLGNALCVTARVSV